MRRFIYTYPTTIPETLFTSLTNYWRFNEASGVVASPAIGTSTLYQTGCTIATGISGNCLRHETGDKINTGVNNTTDFNFSKNASFTLSWWYKPSTTGTVFPRYFFTRRQQVSGYQRGFEIFTDSNAGAVPGAMNIIFWGYGNDNLVYLQSNANNIPNTAWYNIVITWDHTLSTTTSGMTYYVNGTKITGYQKQYNTLSTYDFLTDSQRTWVGTYFDGTTYPMRAYIDELAIWSKCLTQAQVTELYNGGTGTFY